MNNTLGLYLHVPFCLSKCAYCDFYSLSGAREKGRYVDALCRAISDAAKSCGRYTVDSVYFGGGTPSLLTGEELSELMRALEGFSLSSDCEITLEVNPRTANEQTLRTYRALGVNRLSVGMQAAENGRLSALGRRHTAEDTASVVRDLTRAGFDNFSLDLMYGLPEQSDAEWENSLKTALSYGPTHLSLYALTLSENVPLYQMRDLLPDDEAQSRQYETACRLLSEHGLEQYEISNFAQSGKRCRHNLRYWTRGDYLGFGPAAASCFQNRRHTASADLSAFLSRPTGLLERIASEEELQEDECRAEEILLRLRLTEGLTVDKAFLSAVDAPRFLSEIEKLEGGGFCKRSEGRLSLTPSGFFVSNEIISRLLIAAGL